MSMNTAVQAELDVAPPPPRTVLLNPGPVNVHDSVREAMGYADVCHREPEVGELMRRVRAKITAVCGGREEGCRSVVVTGSGTAALEATFSSVVPVEGKILILNNGHYGRRLHEIVTVHEIACRHLEFGWTSPFDLHAIERELASDPSIGHVGMVHHETSTGMLNPLRAVGEIVARHGRSLVVDAISSLGSEPLDMQADHVDWCVGTANKCIEGLPGISFVCARKDALEALSGGPRRSYYLDLYTHYQAQELHDAPAFTPAVQVLYALDQALALTLRETAAGRGARYRECAQKLRAGLRERGFELLLSDEHRCNNVTVAIPPSGVAYQPLHDALKARGFVIYATQPEVGPSVRIANMGQVGPEHIAGFFLALDEALAEATPGAHVRVGAAETAEGAL